MKLQERRNQFSIVANNNRLIEDLKKSKENDVLRMVGINVVEVEGKTLVMYVMDNKDLADVKVQSRRMFNRRRNRQEIAVDKIRVVDKEKDRDVEKHAQPVYIVE